MAAQGESPAVARRRVRLALRKAREATGLSQSAVADRVGWSMSKVQRIESGDVSVSGTDLRALLDLYGVTDAEEVEQLSEEARISRRQRWWTVAEYRRHLTPAYAQLLQFEAEATAVRSYQTVLIPGVLQTPAYAQAVIGSYDESLTADERRVRFDARMQRRRQFLESERASSHYVILDESILDRVIGGFEVMAEQFGDVARVARTPGVHIRIVPLTEGAILGQLGPFLLLDLGGDDDPDDAVLYRESFTRDSIEHSAAEITFHRRMFEKLWRRSLDEEKTVRALEATAAQLRTRADRQ